MLRRTDSRPCQQKLTLLANSLPDAGFGGQANLRSVPPIHLPIRVSKCRLLIFASRMIPDGKYPPRERA
jgi:hypothetical protein